MDRYGLGYRPTNLERGKEAQKKREKMMVIFGKQDLEDEPMVFLLLYKTYCLGGHIHPNLPMGREEEASILGKAMAQLPIHMVGHEKDDNK